MIIATQLTLREYLQGHKNWAETAPDRFECIVEHKDIPRKIELQETGVMIYFGNNVSEYWRRVADHTRFCAYEHLLFNPPDNALYPGSLMIIILQELIPSEASRNDLKPLFP